MDSKEKELVPFGKNWIKRNNKKLVLLPYTQGQSTSKIIDKIKNAK